MKSSVLALALTLAVAVSTSVSAQTHAELQTMVQQLQTNPTDTALRERIIAAARALKPAPAIPEAARESFVQGTTIAQTANDTVGQALAVQRFEQALRIAPWWGDAWYNLAVAQELAGQLDAAQTSLKLYLLTGLSEAEARKTQDHIYALKAKKDLAATEAAAGETAERQAQARARMSIVGEWTFRDGSDKFVIQDSNGQINVRWVGMSLRYWILAASEREFTYQLDQGLQQTFATCKLQAEGRSMVCQPRFVTDGRTSYGDPYEAFRAN